MSLENGLNALKQKRYAEAVQWLEDYCQYCQNSLGELSDHHSQEYSQAQAALVKAYSGNGENKKAIALCRKLENHPNSQVSNWAKKCLTTLTSKSTKTTPTKTTAKTVSKSRHKAGRVAQTGIRLAMKGIAGNLALASGVTISLLFGMVLVLALSLLLILNSNNPVTGLIIAVAITLIFNVAAFFISPWIMDLTQRWLYQTRWVTLADIQRYSPESAEVIERVCQEKNIKQPRLGIIDDQNPTAFTYGSLPNSARLVVSQGLFTYLDDDEIATVYAHELGHIVHWDFAVMTLAATLVQITYLIYSFARRISRGGGNSKGKDAAQTAAMVAYVFYIIGTYLVLYLSRTREYYADHFAAETTGNPNALSRALVKIAYGIVEEGQGAKEPSKLIEGTRSLGIYDHKAAASTGTAYRIASDSQKVGQVFLWDIFNPWGWWMELNSTHPLTGKRVRALTTYAEQMDLETEFDMATVVREGNQLSKKKLYGNFAVDIVLFNAQFIGSITGLMIASIVLSWTAQVTVLPSFMLFGFAVGTLIKTLVMYPDFKQSSRSDIFTLMCDPYASPLRGRPVKLQGELIGRGDAGYKFGSDLKLQDRSGMIYTRYASRFGPIGNFLFGGTKVQNLIGSQVNVVGWFRRGIAPWLDLIQLESNNTTVNSYHRFWSLTVAVGAIILGFGLFFVL
ncbi:peptidase M48 [Moorena producens PAL-8-15-08-1]|uniref:Peptidase M48 n=1 Tax=Moorena producens PAL-8-15-08-1 TaxID=1458985 RepID=A0A1D8U294_9CYAN|nr:zinc metalloprotease HtpX [Moorena producens]AOX04021.1 peptidase M48 [Moorena producens PAL-8-15-08-1]